MAKKLKVGDTLHGYRITKVFGPGMMAISYAAQTRSSEKVFFKQYKSPAPTVVWYPAFVAYQKELGARVAAGPAAHLAVRQLDAFEEAWGGRCYFQAFEFVDQGGDMQQLLDTEREHHRRTGSAPARDPAVWARHVTWARVLVSAIVALHQSRVVHADLKPANVYLVKDATIASGYQLKLIDMDFSLLSDQRAPWHGHQGYVGSDNYRSPEHLARGTVPTPASDVFTCGLILYELLAGEHPYWRDEQADYGRLVTAHAARPPALLGLLPAPANNAEVSALLHRCLAPDPSARPSAAELRAALSGRTAASKAAATGAAAPSASASASASPSPSARAPLPKPAPMPAAKTPAAAPPASRSRSPGQPLVADGIELVGPDGAAIQLGVRTELGKELLRRFGPDAQYWDPRQCVLERLPGRPWTLVPIAGTANETLVNGEAITTPRPLHDGDRIGVGRQAKGIVKLPLTVRAR